ncbi:MAG TPA: thiamine phosphate synthase [Gaiellaceae bacterium]|nr:thiamine phosphate synthase [Gaiellaceae bacterium]
MRLHAIVTDLATAVSAVEGGATVVQLRLKGASTGEVIETGRAFLDLPATFVVNDDVEAALALGADGVHLGRDDPGAERALEQGLMLGTSASSVDQATAGRRLGAAYIGAGPVWETPSKPNADPPIGLDGLREICKAVSIPVVAIGGIDATNAADCIAAGAAGVAVVRAAVDARAVSEALAGR